MESKLGYLLSRPLLLGEAPTNSTMLYVITTPHHQVESTDPNRFWDPPPLDLLMTPTETNDQTAIGNFKETNITRSPDDTYCARFPWRTEYRPLPSNYTIYMCKGTRLLACRLGQEPKLLKTYSDILAAQEEKGLIDSFTINAQLRTRISFRSIQFKDCYRHERKPMCRQFHFRTAHRKMNDVTYQYKSARSIMSSGNFNLRAWVSNIPTVTTSEPMRAMPTRRNC
jgi:hypothetical protein